MGPAWRAVAAVALTLAGLVVAREMARGPEAPGDDDEATGWAVWAERRVA